MISKPGKLKDKKEAELFMKFVSDMLDENYICMYCKHEELNEYDEGYRASCESCIANNFNKFIAK